ncbi:MAG: serine hydrolase [Candidatus Omnitrophota bacterium]
MKRKINTKRFFVDLLFAAAILSVGLLCASGFFPYLSCRLEAEHFLNKLDDNLPPVLAEFNGRFAFSFKNMNNKFINSQKDEQERFPAASLIKVPILAAALLAVKEKSVSLEDEFVLAKKDITPGSGVLRYGKFPKKMSFYKILKFMITRSDNTATNKVISILGDDYLNAAFKRLNLKDTELNRRIMDFTARGKGVENYISCRDLSFLFEKIYRKDLVDAAASEIMLSFLKEQKINDRIPKYLPESVTVAHKTGLEKTVVGDGGIVFCDNGDYVICVVTSDFSSYRQAKDFIAKVSLAVYNTSKDILSAKVN